MPQLPGEELSYTSTISRGLVHRAAVSEVFLTDSFRSSEGVVHTAAQLPRVHSYYSDQLNTPAVYDTLLLLEVARQNFVYITHEYLGTPQDSKFIFNEGELDIIDIDALRVGETPGSVLVSGTVVKERYRKDELVGATIEMTLSIDGTEAVSVRLIGQWLPPRSWARLRDRGRSTLEPSGQEATPPSRMLSPASVGRVSPRNVVLGDVVVFGEEVVGQILVDKSHPALFDHPLDHIPGALLFEGFRQTALHAADELLGMSPNRLVLTRFKASFNRFGEFELPTACRAEIVDDRTDTELFLRLAMQQGGDTISTAEVALRCTSPRTALRGDNSTAY